MNRFDRPKQPIGWNHATRPARQNLRKLIRQDSKAVLPKDAVPPLWRDKKVAFSKKGSRSKLRVKDIFSNAQHLLCGYCTTRLSNTGDLDHYLPTRSITRKIEAHGEEIAPSVPRIKGRKLRPAPPHRPGWWEQAYRWKNYVFSCNLCNETWKKDLCLAQLNGKRHLKGRRRSEIALLLNPFDDDADPHLRFEDTGFIYDKTARGKATIQTCGLDRPTLVAARLDRIKDTKEACKDIAQARDKKDRRERYRKLVATGDWTRPHALAVRQTAVLELGITWAVIESRAKP